MNLLSLVFPQGLYCLSCGRPLPSGGEGSIALCDLCADEIIWVTGKSCLRCGRPLAAENPADYCHDCSGTEAGPFAKGYACALYSGRAAGLVRDMKYRDKAWYADTISALMAERYISLADPETGELAHYDYLAAVPMTSKKKSARGYDQAALLAKGLSRRIGVPYLPKALSRVRETEVMSSLSAEERRQNLKGVFSVRYDMIDHIAKRRILLVDDVYTTGSSVSACSEALINAGAAAVDVIVFAIGADSKSRETFY